MLNDEVNAHLAVLERTYFDIPDALVSSAITDHQTSHDRGEGLGTLRAFDLARSVGYGEVEYRVMPEVASLLDLNAGDSFIDFGCGIGCFLLFLAMNYPQCNFVGVEVVASRYDIAVQARHRLSVSLPNFEHRVHLILGDFLSRTAQMEINLTRLSVAFMSDMLLPEVLHHELVQLIVSRCPALRRIVKCKSMPRHFRGNFEEKGKIMVQCSWSATPVAFYVYDRINC